MPAHPIVLSDDDAFCADERSRIISASNAVTVSAGRMISGADALIALWRHIPRYRLLENGVSLPVVHWCSEQGCPVFARLRYKSRCNDAMCTKA